MKNPFILLIIFFSCSVSGQVTQKRNLTEGDYHLWSTMELDAVSAKGDWVSYHLAYESHNDTLFVRNSRATKTYSFPKAYDGIFIKDSWFACMLPEKVLSVVTLKTETRREMKDITQYAFSADGSTLITLSGTNELSIGQLDGDFTEKIEGVTGFFLNPSGTAMVYSIAKDKFSLHYCSFEGKSGYSQKLLSDVEATFDNIVWQGNGDSFAFVKSYSNSLDHRNGKNLYLYQFKGNKLYAFDVNTNSTIAKDSKIEPPLWTRFTISEDGKRVFFYLGSRTEQSTEKSLVQLWNGNDPWTYSQLQKEGRWDLAPKCAVWFPENNQFMQLTTNKYPKLMLSGDQKYALTYNPMGSKPQSSFYSKTDWYITELNTGKRSLILEDLVCDMNEITPSYGGKYVAYRKDAHWWVYELATGKHINISKGIPQKIYDGSNDRAGLKPAYGIAGWTAADESIIIYDEYDLWSIQLKDHKTKRLTKGREQQIIFRLANQLGQTDRLMNFDGFTFPLLDLKAGLYLRAFGKFTKQSGYYSWNKAEKMIVFADKNITQFGFTKESKTFYYKEQDFNAAPTVMAMEKNSLSSNLVINSNPQQADFHWGKSELISYINSKNQHLQAALYYPANYDKKKMYPMVVYIYEKLSQHVHEYVNPSLFNGAGINISNLTTQGYFVLYPDISYEMDNVGRSATDCVVSATNAVIAKGLVQADKIALTGHSFGGYEVAFIATQTNIFATVISGSGVSDLLSHYLSIGWNNGRAESWRYEDQQWRMSKSLFENMDDYLRNSPVKYAQQLTQPILIWTGELDRQVHYYQSIAFYNALRRLGKKEIMLIYPDNRHILTQEQSQIDFTHKYEQWIATYLKNVPPPDWIRDGVE